MIGIMKLDLSNSADIFNDIALALYPFRDEAVKSVEYIVEGSIGNPQIIIKYPGYKVEKKGDEYYNLFDFYVEPYINNEPRGELFTHENIIHDFITHKIKSEEFWELVEIIYKENKLMKDPPKLEGIDPRIFLLTLKWIWIQEDFNYRLFYYKDIKSPTPYKLITRGGKIIIEPKKGREMLYEALQKAKEGADFRKLRTEYISIYKR